MTTQTDDSVPEEVLQHEAEAARERLLAAIDRLDTRAKTWVQHAAENTRVSGWGIVGAVALWAGVAAITRRRRRSQQTGLVLRSRPRSSLARRAGVIALRGAAALVGFLASRSFALRLIAERHERRAVLPSDLPQMRRSGDADALLLPAQPLSTLETRGTPNA